MKKKKIIKTTISENIEDNKKIIVRKKNFNYVRFIIHKIFSSLLQNKEEKLSISDEEKNNFYVVLKETLTI